MPVIELDYCPHPYQAEVHEDPSRFKLIIGGRRVGKSKMALHALVRHCLEAPNRNAWWVAPTHAMARDIGLAEFRANLAVLQPAIESVNESLGRVRFRNGSVMHFKGAESERSLRGRGLTFCVVDEAAFMAKEVWTRALVPALSDNQGGAWLVTTPMGRGNWVYELMCEVTAGITQGTWCYRHWPTMLNPIETTEEIAHMAATMSEIDFRQEVLAEFVSKAGYVFADFNQDNILWLAPDEVRLSPSPHEYDIFLGVDFGFANPCAVVFMAVDNKTDEVIQFDEIYSSHLMIEEIEARILATLRKHDLQPSDVRYIYTDPAGNADELQSGVSPVDFLRMSPQKWRVVNKKSLIAPGLALVRSFVCSSTGIRRFKVTSNCVKSIESLRGYAYDSSERTDVVREEALKDGKHDHACDAIRYFFVNRFDQAKYVAYTPEQTDYSGSKTGRKVHMKRCTRCRKQFPSRLPANVPPFLCRGCAET